MQMDYSLDFAYGSSSFVVIIFLLLKEGQIWGGHSSMNKSEKVTNRAVREREREKKERKRTKKLFYSFIRRQVSLYVSGDASSLLIGGF